MTTLERSLLRRFAADTHAFEPEATTASAYGWFNEVIVPALERLQAKGYLAIEARAANSLFSPGGPCAACLCQLTPAGRAASALLRKEYPRDASVPGRRQEAYVGAEQRQG